MSGTESESAPKSRPVTGTSPSPRPTPGTRRRPARRRRSAARAGAAVAHGIPDRPRGEQDQQDEHAPAGDRGGNRDAAEVDVGAGSPRRKVLCPSRGTRANSRGEQHGHDREAHRQLDVAHNTVVNWIASSARCVAVMPPPPSWPPWPGLWPRARPRSWEEEDRAHQRRRRDEEHDEGLHDEHDVDRDALRRLHGERADLRAPNRMPAANTPHGRLRPSRATVMASKPMPESMRPSKPWSPHPGWFMPARPARPPAKSIA